MKALILTGPKDGQLIDYHGQRLDLLDDASPRAYLILRFKRVIFYDGERYIDFFVPYEWPDGDAMRNKILTHLIRQAFERAV